MLLTSSSWTSGFRPSSCRVDAARIHFVVAGGLPDEDWEDLHIGESLQGMAPLQVGREQQLFLHLSPHLLFRHWRWTPPSRRGLLYFIFFDWLLRVQGKHKKLQLSLLCIESISLSTLRLFRGRSDCCLTQHYITSISSSSCSLWCTSFSALLLFC